MSNRLEVIHSPTSLTFLNKSPSLQRKEQISSWRESPTNKEKSHCKNSTKVNFSLNVCFLSACGNGDIDDAQILLERGADVDAKNIDGITSLHQSCLDDNDDVLEFLLQNNANVNAQDLEGWTPLHAAAYCGYADIVERLIQHGADPGLINSDGELPIDLAEKECVSDVLRNGLAEKHIDVEEARDRERRQMLADISDLRRQNKGTLRAADFAAILEPVTKATPLHVAAAKGYNDVMSALLECSTGLLEAKDVDGWTPLHAAAHWGHKDAVRLLCEAGANLDATNAATQTPSELAEPDMTSYLRQLKEKFGVKLRRNAARNILDNSERKSMMANRRSSVNRLSMDQKTLMRMSKEKSPVVANMMEKMLKNRRSNSPLLDEPESTEKDHTLKINPPRGSDCLSPCPSPSKSPKSPRSPLSPLSLPKMEELFEEGHLPDMKLAHSTMVSHFLNVSFLPLTRTREAEVIGEPEPEKEEGKVENKVRISYPRASVTSIESEEPSMIVHDDEPEVGPEAGDASPAPREKDPSMTRIPEDDEPVTRRSGHQQSPRGSAEVQEEDVPRRRSKINSLVVKSNESDWRLHRNAISEHDEESETVRRISRLMAPEKLETESQRAVSCRQSLSNRRSTQGEVDALKSKISPLNPIDEVEVRKSPLLIETDLTNEPLLQSIPRLEALEARLADLEQSNLELRTHIADLLKSQEAQQKATERSLAAFEAMQDRITAVEQENAALKQQNTMEELKGENSKLRDENSSLVRVISRLSRSRDHEDDACHKACDRCDEHFGAYIASLTRL